MICIDTAYKCYSIINVQLIRYQMMVRPKGFFRSTHLLLTPLHLPCGDEGTRTPDLLLAKEALSRLSYIPGYLKSGPFGIRT